MAHPLRILKITPNPNLPKPSRLIPIPPLHLDLPLNNKSAGRASIATSATFSLVVR